MENIDDDLEREGIIIIRLDNADEAKEYGLDHLPAMVYFENKIPAIYEGDLMNGKLVCSLNSINLTSCLCLLLFRG